nr:uncharacterized protein LOC117281691 isoform X1 [Nicotiana tomentosiformis]
MLPLLLPIYVPLKLIDTNDKVPSSSPVVGSRQREAEIELKYVYATNSLPDLRTFGENLTFSLETNATESKEVKFHSSNRGSYIQPLCIEHINLVIQFSWDPPRYESKFRCPKAPPLVLDYYNLSYCVGDFLGSTLAIANILGSLCDKQH